MTRGTRATPSFSRVPRSRLRIGYQSHAIDRRNTLPYRCARQPQEHMAQKRPKAAQKGSSRRCARIISPKWTARRCKLSGGAKHQVGDLRLKRICTAPSCAKALQKPAYRCHQKSISRVDIAHKRLDNTGERSEAAHLTQQDSARRCRRQHEHLQNYALPALLHEKRPCQTEPTKLHLACPNHLMHPSGPPKMSPTRGTAHAEDLTPAPNRRAKPMR